MEKKANYEITKPYYLSFWSIFFVVLVIILFAVLRKFVCFDRNMFFYFFASTSQSMAALFAVGGVFAIFRFQAQEAKLRNLYDVYKKWLIEDDRHGYFDVHPDLWKDDQIVSIGRETVENWRERIDKDKKTKGDEDTQVKKDEKVIDDIEDRIDEIDDNEKKRNSILTSVKFPMLVILITFMISIGSLPFTSYISKSFLGLIILILTMALITYSMCCVFTFIKFSLSLKKKPS